MIVCVWNHCIADVLVRNLVRGNVPRLESIASFIGSNRVWNIAIESIHSDDTFRHEEKLEVTSINPSVESKTFSFSVLTTAGNRDSHGWKNFSLHFLNWI